MALGDDLAPLKMTDNGMWLWAGALTVVFLVASYFVAVWWQRWKGNRPDG